MEVFNMDYMFADIDIVRAYTTSGEDGVEVCIVINKGDNYHSIYLTQGEVEAIMSKILELDRF